MLFAYAVLYVDFSDYSSSQVRQQNQLVCKHNQAKIQNCPQGLVSQNVSKQTLRIMDQ